MSEPVADPTPPAPPPSPAPVTAPRTPPGTSEARTRPTGAVLMLVAGGAVLVGALVWLALTPRPQPSEASATALRGLSDRVAALENRPAPAPARAPSVPPELEARIAALEQASATAGNGAAARQELDRRLAALESRPAPDLSQLAQRSAVAALEERLAALSNAQANLREAGQQIEALRQRLAGIESAMPSAAAREELQNRLSSLESTQTAMREAAARARRVAAQAQLATRLEGGQALGEVLGTLGDNPPPALARFRETAPPTEAALRLAFDDAARAALAASEPAREGQGVLDAALARVTGLVTIRRGDQVVWGDTVAADLELARKSLDAGDLAGAVARLKQLPAPARAGMESWISRAEALLAARAALRDLTAG